MELYLEALTDTAFYGAIFGVFMAPVIFLLVSKHAACQCLKIGAIATGVMYAYQYNLIPL